SSSAVQLDLTGPNGYTAFTGATASSGLIDLPSTGTYTVTAHTAGQAGSYAFALNVTSVTPLTLNVPSQGTLAASGQAQLFTVTLTGTTALGVILTDLNSKDQNEVYVSRGAAPSRDSYQYRFSTVGAGQKVVLTGQADIYDILVYNNLVTTPG